MLGKRRTAAIQIYDLQVLNSDLQIGVIGRLRVLVLISEHAPLELKLSPSKPKVHVCSVRKPLTRSRLRTPIRRSLISRSAHHRRHGNSLISAVDFLAANFSQAFSSFLCKAYKAYVGTAVNRDSCLVQLTSLGCLVFVLHLRKEPLFQFAEIWQSIVLPLKNRSHS